jgi:tetratricopeptide (TPR) repeat protein
VIPFFFRSVGQVFRSEDIERIFKFRRFIIDLHRKLHDIAPNHKPKEKTLYRGKKLRSIVLQQLEDNIGALMSINGFLSTTKNRAMAIHWFAGAGANRDDCKSVLFKLSIDETMITRPFADISSISQFQQEEEVLFTIGSVWQIDDVSLDTNDNSLWIVKLKSCKELNSKLAQFLERLPSDNTFLALGDVLRELGQHTKAKNFYNKMLNESNLKDEVRGTLHYKIAMINIAHNGHYEALINLHHAEKLISSVKTNTEPSLSKPLNDHPASTLRLRILYHKGLLYEKTDDYKNALSCFTEALLVEETNPVERAMVHNSLGLLLSNESNYIDALRHLKEAVELAQNRSCMAKFKQDYDAVQRHVPVA